MRILVIDDQVAMLDTIGRMLKRSGHEVTLQQKSREGIALLDREHFDVLITDMVMPELCGIEVIRKVRSDHPDLWIVAISGGGDMLSTTMTLTLSEAFGADRILYKPFVKSELLDALQQAAA